MDIVEITFPSGGKEEFTKGVTAEELIPQSELKNTADAVVAVRLNNELVSLSYHIVTNCELQPVYLNSKDGMKLYRRTLCFLLALASSRLFPERRLVIGHSIGDGYYCCFDPCDDNSQDIDNLEREMRSLVEENLLIQHEFVSYREAVRYFTKHHQPHTALLLRFQSKTRIPIYRCGRYIDLSHGPLLARTGMLRTFEFRNYPPGFLLRYPSIDNPTVVPPFVDNPVLFTIYEEYRSWGKILNMDCIGLLNQRISRGNVQEFIRVAEALHDKKIANIADLIAQRRETIRIVLIAGPSSSGKTTFSKKLAIQLRVVGRNPVTVSLDDYFLPREQTPHGPDGKPDFERLEAIDVPLLNEHLLGLLDGQEVVMPRFDFKVGERREKGKTLKLPRRSILILEGIHGLNDRLTPQIERDHKYKIYVSALTQLNLDDHNRISTTDNRLIRRMVRDRQFRGHSALRTLQIWPSVVKGEDRYIFPFQNSADSAFNSALDYELAVLKSYAESLLRTIRPDVGEYSEAIRLLSFLDNVLAIPPDLVPGQSILREFIGRSDFQY